MRTHVRLAAGLVAAMCAAAVPLRSQDGAGSHGVPRRFQAPTAQDVAIRAGRLKPARVTRLTPEHPLAIRTRLGLSQTEFAAFLDLPVRTVRNWEQGRRQPRGPARTLLRIAAKHPSVVRDALDAA